MRSLKALAITANVMMLLIISIALKAGVLKLGESVAVGGLVFFTSLFMLYANREEQRKKVEKHSPTKLIGNSAQLILKELRARRENPSYFRRTFHLASREKELKRTSERR